MKKIALLLVLVIFAAVNVDAGGFYTKLKSCERYGTEVLVTFSLDNSRGADRHYTCERDAVLVLDADGNKYATSGLLAGAPRDGKRSSDNAFYFGIPDVYAPTGSGEVRYGGVDVPDGINTLVRLVVYDVPTTLKSFACIQIRSELTGDDMSGSAGSCLSWNPAEDSGMTIIDVK